MNRKAIIGISAVIISAVTSPAFAAGATQKHRAYDDAGAYASATQLQPGSLAEQRWFDRASSPRND